jgi:hypothetical protein
MTLLVGLPESSGGHIRSFYLDIIIPLWISMLGRRAECVHGFDGKARRKETTWKTKA